MCGSATKPGVVQWVIQFNVVPLAMQLPLAVLEVKAHSIDYTVLYSTLGVLKAPGRACCATPPYSRVSWHCPVPRVPHHPNPNPNPNPNLCQTTLTLTLILTLTCATPP